MPTYKTKDGRDRIIPGIGRTINGQITTDAVIENPMFEVVADAKPAEQPVPGPAPQPAPASAHEQPTQTPAPTPGPVVNATPEQIAASAAQDNTQTKEQK